MPQITASTARRCMARSVNSDGLRVCARAKAASAIETPTAAAEAAVKAANSLIGGKTARTMLAPPLRDEQQHACEFVPWRHRDKPSGLRINVPPTAGEL